MFQSSLNEPILILNKSWYPIDSTTVKASFSDVISERARFLDTPAYIPYGIIDWMKLEVPNNAACIHTPTHKIKVPELMLLAEYSKIPKRVVVFNRRNLWHRDCRICQYCGIEPPYDEITIDHIIPKSKGGKTTFGNCVLCCIKCNFKKADRTPKNAGMVLRKRKKTSDGKWIVVNYDKPKRPKWNPLYALSRKTYPESWIGFLKNFDETLYWEVKLKT